MTLANPMSYGAMTRSLTKSMLEPVIIRWQGVKDFNTNGYYWMSNKTVATVRSLPFYMMDLTSVKQIGLAEVCPMVQLQQSSTGAMYFTFATCVRPDGLSTGNEWQYEKAPYLASGTAATTDTAPFGKSMIQHASISANLWGAKSKATKFKVEIVKILDDDLVPNHVMALAGTESNNATAKRNDFYQNLIKTWTFNPISTTGGLQAKKYKVLKSQTITIEPNPTTDGDADPQCVVYKTFLKLNKVYKYEETSAFLASDVDTNDQGDYVVNTKAQLTTQANPKARIYLVIRATNYGSDGATDTNTVTPSFDLSVRVKHTIPK